MAAVISHHRSGQLLDGSVLRELFGDNLVLRNRLLTMFVSESARDLLALTAALAEGGLEQAQVLAHQLSGAARTVGALSVAESARALEHALRDQRDSAVPEPLLAALQERVAAVHALILEQVAAG